MQSDTALTPTGPNADDRKWQCGRNAAWSHCDMIGIPAVRHSDMEPVGQTNRRIFIYRLHIQGAWQNDNVDGSLCTDLNHDAAFVVSDSDIV